MMKESIERLEAEALKLELNGRDRKELQKHALSLSHRFYDSIKGNSAYQPFDDLELQSILEHPIDEAGADPADLIQNIEEQIFEPGLNVPSGRNFGYIPGSSLESAAIGDYLAAVTNRYASVYSSSPGAVLLEQRVINWMADLIGYGETAGGYLASGGSMANLTAVVTARDSSGLTPNLYPESVVYLTRQTHHCVDRALNIAGLGTCHRRYIEMDERFRMKPVSLRKQIRNDVQAGLTPFMIVASAGSTDTGAVDPMTDIGEIAKKNNTWFHVDAAYGGFFLLTKEGKKPLKGIELSDSVVLDPHKGLFLPYGIGALIVKEVGKLVDTHRYSANYMQSNQINDYVASPADVSPELSKHFRAMRIWLPLKLHGLKAFRSALHEKILLGRYLWQKIGQIKQIETGPAPQLSIFMFRWKPEAGDTNDMNRKLHQEILKAGRVFLSTTEIDGEFFFRVAVLSVRTHLAEADALISVIREKISELER